MLKSLEKMVSNQEAWERFLQIGLPTKEQEAFRYVRLRDLYAFEFSSPRCEVPSVAIKEGRLVFVNGEYSEVFSRPPKEIIALPLSKALKTYAHFLHNRQNILLKEEKDPFAALNGALSSEGLFLYLPPRSQSQLEVMHVITPQPFPVVTTPRMHIFAGKEAEAKFFLLHEGEHWINSFVDAALDERAFLTLTTFMKEGEKSWHFDAIRATLKRESRLKTYAVTDGGATSRQDYVVQLLEEGAEASLYGVCQVEERRHHHVNVLMRHHAPRCRSLQHFRNVLKEGSRTSFEGKIHVGQAAQKTEAFQMNHNLILSRHAVANSKPNLEIFADDVKASHGSTTGQLDEQQLFYLQSRGIPKKEAKALLIKGFCQEILDQIEQPYAHLYRFS